MIAIYKKEMRSYFTSPAGYVALAMLLCAVGIFMWMLNLRAGGYPQLEYALSANGAAMIYIILCPVLAMRSLCEEKRQRTDRLLSCLPISSVDIVLGKYFAMITVLALPCLFLCVYPAILSLYGTVNLNSAYCGILQFYLLGASLCGICMFLSSLTESPLICAVVGALSLLGIYLLPTLSNALPARPIVSVIGFLLLAAMLSLLLYRLLSDWTVTVTVMLGLSVLLLLSYLLKPALFDGTFADFLRAVSLFSVLDRGIYAGILDLGSSLCYASIASAFLFFCTRVLEKARYC